MRVQTTIGFVDFEVMHKNGALQVVKVLTHDPKFFFYNTVHDNGLQLPKTDTSEIANAILICDWCIANFPEFSTEIVNISQARRHEFSDRLYEFRVVQIKDWKDDNA